MIVFILFLTVSVFTIISQSFFLPSWIIVTIAVLKSVCDNATIWSSGGQYLLSFPLRVIEIFLVCHLKFGAFRNQPYLIQTTSPHLPFALSQFYTFTAQGWVQNVIHRFKRVCSPALHDYPHTLWLPLPGLWARTWGFSLSILSHISFGCSGIRKREKKSTELPHILHRGPFSQFLQPERMIFPQNFRSCTSSAGV